MAPRVAIIAEKFGGVGGSERFVQEVTERLAATGHFELHVFANRWQSQCSAVTFHRVPRLKFPRFLRPWSFAVLSQYMIRRGSFDLVHSHWPTFKADVFSTHGAPHGMWIRNVRKRRPKLFDRVMMMIDRRMMAGGGNAVFMPVSTLLKERFQEEFDALPGEWMVVHPGVDAKQFAFSEISRNEVRRTLGITSDAFVVLFVGMNFEAKGLDRLMRGFANLRRAVPTKPMHLVVVGRGNVAKFQKLANELGISGDVIFTGAISGGIERYYSAADVLGMLSEFETFCMVVLEAMAASLPVVIGDQMGVKDLVRDGVNGFVLTDRDEPEVCAERLGCLMDSHLQKTMGESARVTAHARGWDQVADRISRIYAARMTPLHQEERSLP